jgi:CRISPR-associated endonuclease/helicase Cas3
MDMHKYLWAKTSRDKTAAWHPLLFHMLDAGNVALALWRNYLPSSTRNRFASLLRLDEESTGRLLAFWTSLHDIGKASPSFQAKSPERKELLLHKSIPFPPNLDHKPHNLISAWALQALLPPSLRLIGRILAGHHGNLPNGQELLDPARFDQLGRAPIWGELREELFDHLQSVCDPPQINALPEDPAERNALMLLLLGLVTAADWVSSDESRFLYTSPEMDAQDYQHLSVERAGQAVRELGFTGWQPAAEQITFASLFEHRGITSANPIQQSVIDAAADVSSPALVILEAPTGIGKTEAALYLADHWLQESGGRGIYIAMPTTATSNQMFERTAQFLAHRFPHALVNLQLIHGQALLDDSYLALRLAQIGDEDTGRVAAMQWFTSSKKALLAPFGVGTVDQAFLSVLQSRFFFLRLFGLEGKVVIFDEVHAYDTYMSALFERLLGWLRAVGASVIILSATLPDAARRRLAAAYSNQPDISTGDIPPYPRITIQTPESMVVQPLPKPPEISRTIAIDWLERTPEVIVQYLQQRLKDGGCAAVICNTVARSQQIYQTVKEAAIVPSEDCILFHARFPFAWRKEIEDRVLARLKRDGNRPEKAIVIATQVIEQSLDLDFDLMISDLAPVDLLIQRAGRMHRHTRPSRPSRLSTPVLAICCPEQSADCSPDFGPDGFVYSPYYLERTLITLRGLNSIILPEDTNSIIEGVYSQSGLPAAAPEENERLARNFRKLEQEDNQKTFKARNRLILPAGDEGFFFDGTLGLEEDNSEVHRSFQAYTRADPPGLTVVCLGSESDGKLFADLPDPAVCLDEEAALTPEITKVLLSYVVQINHPEVVVNWFLSQPVPPAWHKKAALRYCRCAQFTCGRFPLDGTPYVLRLDRDTGLSITKEVG